jgi:hypothetical protein
MYERRSSMSGFKQLKLLFREIQRMSDTERMILSALQSWRQVITRLDQKLLNLTDEQLENQVAPGRNRLIYLLGHLAVAHDKMRVLLRIGDRIHPELDVVLVR